MALHGISLSFEVARNLGKALTDGIPSVRALAADRPRSGSYLPVATGQEPYRKVARPAGVNERVHLSPRRGRHGQEEQLSP